MADAKSKWVADCHRSMAKKQEMLLPMPLLDEMISLLVTIEVYVGGFGDFDDRGSR